MAILPIVRYMILCDNWEIDPNNAKRVDIKGLLINLATAPNSLFPVEYPKISVLLALSDSYGKGMGRINCVFEETAELVFHTPEHEIDFGKDPLAVRLVSFRILDCSFPYRGMYSVQFWYEGELVEERPLRVR